MLGLVFLMGIGPMLPMAAGQLGQRAPRSDWCRRQLRCWPWLSCWHLGMRPTTELRTSIGWGSGWLPSWLTLES